MRYSLLFFLFIIVATNSYGQNNPGEPYAREWKEIDSLLNRGLPQSAEKLAMSIYERAGAKGQSVQMIKAQLYLLNANSRRSEDADRELIEKAEAQIAVSSFPETAIWQSITAQLYWNYYQANRWKILDRTQVSSSAAINDFEQWDTERFFQKIISLYNSSLQMPEELKKISIEKYDPILSKGTNSRNLRPTLFDLLAFRAINFYENDEKDVTKPAYQFIMDDEKDFAAAGQFIRQVFRSHDSLSLQWKALTLYQQVLKLHIDDTKPDALLDADLQRLAFIYRYSVLPDKKELYDKALEQLEREYAGNPLSAMASYNRVLLRMQQPATRNKYTPGNTAKEKIDYVAIKNKLEAIIAKHPGSEGAVNAAQLLENLLSKSLAVQAEEVVLPNEPSKFLLTYKNIAEVWVRVIPVDADKYKRSLTGRDADWFRNTLAIPGIQQFHIGLMAADDFDEHSTEVKISALPAGMYMVLVSEDRSFSQENNPLNYTIFQSSGLSIITQQSGRGYVLDRKNGSPVAGASVTFYTQSYNNRQNTYEDKKAFSVLTSGDGSFDIPAGNSMQNYNSVTVQQKDDVLRLNDYLNFYKNDIANKPRIQTFFFTDRPIYRPGQTIFFKGIMVNIDEGGKKNNVVANKETEVIFYDVNGQQVASQKLTTNDFGSFTGSFKAPEGVLNGNMRISDGHGDTYISVEEYKRPKFAVVFDTLRETYALNDQIKLTGKAQAYAGNAVDGATVKYRVVRRARWPFWWSYYRWGMPASSEQEIAQGTTTTRSDGTFDIKFSAIPDRAVDEQSLPVFNYTVYADVTDINGETRSATQSVSVGYVSAIITTTIPEKARPVDLDTLKITTTNLNNNFVSLPVRIKISKLAQPSTVYRKRLWPVPDQFIIDSITFRKDFPFDEYRNESDHTTWAVSQTVFERSIKTTPDGQLPVPENAWNENGWYVVVIEARDQAGKAVMEKKYIQVWDRNNKGNVNDPLLVVPEQQESEPGQRAQIFAMSGYQKAHILQEEKYMDNTDKRSLLSYNGKPLEWNKEINGSDRGGIAVKYLLIKENRIYQQDAYINVPWTNKELDIRWETHRDKLLPGETDHWTMVISGNKKEKVAAEMVTTLYDASLDAFKPHSWAIYSLFPAMNNYMPWNTNLGFGTVSGSFFYDVKRKGLPSFSKSYDAIIMIPGINYGGLDYMDALQTRSGTKLSYAAGRSKNIAAAPASAEMKKEADIEDANENAPQVPKEAPQQEISIRKNLQETAFFFPQLRTDEEGNIRFQFTMPEALTEWKLMAFAHTKDMCTGLLDGKVKTQKDLMIVPNLPRFLRQGDDIVISSKISNLSAQQLNGTATLHIIDAQTLKPLDIPFRLTNTQQEFTIDKDRSANAEWTIHVPESLYEPVIIRITAQAGNFTDGEENMLPVVTNRMLVTETLPLPVNGNQTRSFTFDKLLHSDSSKTISQYRLTLEYTANPAWYAVQALPYLMEYPYECAEQTFNRYYATALAAHIVDKAPRVKEIFKSWREIDTAALLSNLEKNQELKTALLEETPWVLEAKNETEQKKRIGLLFEAAKLSRSLDANMKKLKEMQMPDGSFPWFKGMYADRYITQYIVTGLVRLQHLGIEDTRGNMQGIITRALPYLDREIANDYQALIENKADMSKQHISYYQVQYLYMRSFSKGASGKAVEYYKGQAAKFWPEFNPYMKGMIAIALHRDGNKKEAANIIQSLKETAIQKEEMGMYWMQRGYSYWWYEAPIEAQALLIECFSEVTDNTKDIDAMKIWLLKQKQTQNWQTTKATADACYALLLQGTQWLEHDPVVSVSLGDKHIDSRSVKQEKGTGYFKVNYTGDQVQPNMGNIKVTVANNENSTSWGAVYWQYFEQMDKITPAKTPLELKKELFIERNTDRGPVLEPVTAGNVLKVGDKVKARIEIIVDRDMEYVHLKDMRASCFEPVNVLSGYKWQGGLGYYESTKDASTNFFFGYLRKGKYVFEYPVHVMVSGEFSNGIATIQCMYAPEFSSHTGGIKIKVAAR